MFRSDGFYVDYDEHGHSTTDRYRVENGFVFYRMDDPKAWDTIVVRVPQSAECWVPKIGFSGRMLEEHVRFINEKNITKAIVIADDLSFLKNCPTLTELSVIPSDDMEGTLDYSPLYDMPNLKKLICRTYRDSTEIPVGCVEYDRIEGLKELYIEDSNRDKGYERCASLRTLCIQGLHKCDDLSGCFDAEGLRELDLVQGKMKTLNGLGRSRAMERVSVSYCRTLADIDGLAEVADTLQFLEIDNCGKIKDFSVLEKLTNLQELILIGKNELPDLHFLRNMPKLWRLVVNMNVRDGDLSLCMDIDYVYIYPDRRHYNLKDADLSKNWRESK